MEITVGMLGFGQMGRVHAYAWRNIPLFYNGAPCRIRLVGVAEPSEPLAKAAVEQAGFEWSTADPEEVIGHEGINVIDVCTPNSFHADALRSAMAAGKHIYCEKPLARDLREAEEIEALAARTTGKKQMVSEYRYLPAIMKAKELVDDGFIGEPYHFRGAYLHSGYIDKTRPLAWRMQKSVIGGGVLMDLGPHILDIARHLNGEITAVNGTIETFIKERPKADGSGLGTVDVEDAAWSLLRFENGSAGTVEMSRVATGAEDEMRFEMRGSYGALRFNLMQPNYLDAYDATLPEADRGWQSIATVQKYPAPAMMPASKFTLGWLRSHVAAQYAFADAIVHDKITMPTFRDGLMVHRLIQSIYDSVDGGWQAVDTGR